MFDPVIETQLYPGQGLGNQMWVIAAARGIAVETNRAHVITGHNFYKGAGIFDIESAPESILEAGAVAPFRETLYYDHELGYHASWYDHRVENLPPRVRLEGLFQSERYFFGRLKELGSWLCPTEEVKRQATQYSDVIVLNLRGGEYKRHKNLILPKSYWDFVLGLLKEQTGLQTVLIVTDDQDYAKAFFPNLDVLTGGILECVAALHGAGALGVSNSSFSYFPIKTRSDTPLVIAPAFWSRYQNPHGRWASPANVYQDWSWLQPDGTLLSCKEAYAMANQTGAYYEQTYTTRTDPTLNLGLSLSAKVPDWLKSPVKKIARKFIPTKVG